MITSILPATSPITELVFGDSLFFPPLFKSVLLGFFFWLLIHPLLRDWMYSGEIWHPTLLDLSVFILCIAASLGLLIIG
ncbi:MAG TPA: hypothetical protein DD850_13840 [Erwinia persicina]|uniref:DUF1656 domain-containing protein n=1 Tax=Erwinia persicina TaxID=55211 RepID=A0A3S7S3L6_9GAMM|nr:DUF1656 domain-containing protein [Erwinia persicina]AXU95331.1 hypothetical protein CI789_08860 [Erwinia persicina]MBC3944240.1 DUF1656 domain-containing protein [Erwinia persicina]MBD8105265.1 DUF1656 domain-containing protein [Erwinia persicina]MBD8165862.1 DUF1656 domain-containing protein [Erwinia persicina]MBD8208411.1 DUF1656 domain-containing protein [Erwinia persicina]